MSLEMMNVLSYEPEFEALIDKIREMPNGEKLLDLSGISKRKLDFNKFTEDFIGKKDSNVADLSVDSNSNIKERTIVTYLSEAPKGIFRLNNYYQIWRDLKNKYGIDRANEAIKADITGDIYIADQHLWNTSYCFAFSAYQILEEGMPFIKSPVSKPAVHLDSFLQHIIQSTMYFSNSIAGAVAFPDLFPALSFVYRYDKSIGYPTSDPVEFDKWVEQQFQLFVYTINQPYRSGTQSPFVNISVFDKFSLEDMFGGLSWTNPKTGEFVDIDLKLVDKLQRQFSEWFVRESNEQVFTFPVMTSVSMAEIDNQGKRRVKDEEFFRWVAEINKDRCLFNCYISEESGKLSSCCRLRNDTTKMKQFFNSLGSGSDVKIGSHRVISINLPRLANNSSSLDDFLSKLSKKMELSRDILKIHRELIQNEIDLGLLPLYSLGFMELKKQYSTIGIVGFYEAMQILGYDIVEDSNIDYAKKVINYMNDRNEQFSEEDGYLYNLEQVPAESLSIKLAQKDKILNGMKYEMYSNQFLPLIKNVPLTKRIKLQGVFDASMSGGSVLHINIAEKIKSTEMLLTLMNHAVENNVIYFAINMNLAVCSNHHITIGKVDKCAICGEDIVENYLRVVGFMTPVSSWKEERRGKIDYESRVFY